MVLPEHNTRLAAAARPQLGAQQQRKAKQRDQVECLVDNDRERGVGSGVDPLDVTHIHAQEPSVVLDQMRDEDQGEHPRDLATRGKDQDRGQEGERVGRHVAEESAARATPEWRERPRRLCLACQSVCSR